MAKKTEKLSGFDRELFIRSVKYNVKTLFRKNMEEASNQEIFQAVSYAIKDMIVDNLLNLTGVSCSIKVSADQQEGEYLLAKNVLAFNKDVSIRNIGLFLEHDSFDDDIKIIERELKKYLYSFESFDYIREKKKGDVF